MNYNLVAKLENEGVNVSRLREEFPDGRFVNTYAAKGPVSIVDSKGEIRYFWTDRKDSGYPNIGIRDKLVFRGGNWRREEGKPIPASPRDVYLKELDEELRSGSHIKGLKGEKAEAVDRRLKQALRRVVEPVADFFTLLPAEAVGNPKLPKNYCDLTSIFRTQISEDELRDILEISSGENFRKAVENRLNDMSTESTQIVTPVCDLRNGRHNRFGWGDDYKLADLETPSGMYFVRGVIVLSTGQSSIISSTDTDSKIEVEGGTFKPIVVVKLDTNPDLSFEERRQYLEPVLRADNNPWLTQASDSAVFEGRKRV